MSVGERIKELRQDAGLSQERFAESIGLKPSMISMMESGRNDAADRTILAICREYHVSESWLRNGIGEKYLPMTDREKIASWVKDLPEDEEFKVALVDALASLDTEGWRVVRNIIKKAAEAIPEVGSRADPLADAIGERPEGLSEEEWNAVVEVRLQKASKGRSTGSRSGKIS